jgi:hypothetical protein
VTTRRQLLVAGLAAAAGGRPVPARAASDEANADRTLLDQLVVFSGAVLYAYDQVLAHAPLRAGERPVLTRLREQAAQSDAAVRQALRRKGGTAPPRSEAAQVSKPPPGSRAAQLRYLVQNEEGMTANWYTALQKLHDRHLIAGVAAYMAAGGRRLVVLRNLAGLPLLPRAFETGGS